MSIDTAWNTAYNSLNGVSGLQKVAKVGSIVGYYFRFETRRRSEAHTECLSGFCPTRRRGKA